MKPLHSMKIPLTVIMVKDPKTGGFTAFFKQLPDIIAEGDSDTDVLKNLMNAVYDVFQFKNQIKSEQTDKSINIIERTVDFCLESCV